MFPAQLGKAELAHETQIPGIKSQNQRNDDKHWHDTRNDKGIEVHVSYAGFDRIALFLGHVRIPILMVNGTYDTILPPETSQQPMFERWGAERANKRYVQVASGHWVTAPEVRNETVREVLSWLDDKLGKPAR